MSNFGFEVALSQLGIPLLRANVGDRYVIEGMKRKTGASAGKLRPHSLQRCDDYG